MQIICLDLETYFDREFTLKRMTTEAYIRDDRFEVHGAAIKWNKETPAQWYDARQLEWQLKQVDWNDTGVICHHAQFDGLILRHHFNIAPRHWFCTLSMARLLVGNHLPLGLDALAKHFGLGAKSQAYMFAGKHYAEMSMWERSALAEGSKHDVALTWQLFDRLRREFPAEEYELVDMTVRMFTEPRLVGDRKLLGEIWNEENGRHNDLLRQFGLSEQWVRSNDQFATLLEERGIAVHYKQGKNGPIPAVGKHDQFLLDLLDSEDEEIAALAAARLDLKSSIIATRAAAINSMSSRGNLCIYLLYCGAHTTRWSGGDKCNFQNLRRGHAIRQTIRAPAGFLLAVPDQSQIECRILNFLAGEIDVIEKFRAGGDPYTGIASEFYQRPITKADQPERGTGKQAELSCGYGVGAAKFKRVAKLGTYGPPVTLSDDEAARFVNLYRSTHPAVVRYWRAAERALAALAGGHDYAWGPMTVKDGSIYLPNGSMLRYELEWQQDEDGAGWKQKTRAGWQRLYGAKLVEQTTQSLARLSCAQSMLRICRAGFSVVGTSHDEAWVLIKDDHTAKEAAEFIRQEMCRVPDWLPGIPLDAEVVVDRRYAK
jgi:DNA polymerase